MHYVIKHCLDTRCFGCWYACVLYFCIYTCSAQLSMFHIERHSRNTLIIIINKYYYKHSSLPALWSATKAMWVKVGRAVSKVTLTWGFSPRCSSVHTPATVKPPNIHVMVIKPGINRSSTNLLVQLIEQQMHYYVNISNADFIWRFQTSMQT